jgi:hypothetical protein
VTLLVAVQTKNTILFWGDGQGTFTTDSDVFTDCPAPLESLCKVMPWGVMPGLRWGFAGSSRIGLDLARTIDGLRLSSWDAVKATVEEAAIDIVNSRRRLLGVAAGEHAGLETWFLFAGIVDGETKMLRIDEHCLGEWVPDLAAEGLGANQFRLIWNVYGDLQPEDQIREPSRFLVFLESFARRSSGLHPPGQLWVLDEGDWSEWR